MITGFYAGILALLYVRLSLKIVDLRRQHKVSIGDGDNDELKRAIATHTNASQYIPIALLLLFLLEQQELHGFWLHLAGIAFVAGRWLHSQALPSDDFKQRVLGMQLTIGTIIALAVFNLLVAIF